MKSIKSRMLLTSLVVMVGFMILTAVALEKAVEKRMLKAEEDKLLALMYSVLAAVDQDATGFSITVSDARLFENALFDSQSGLNALIFDKDKEIWRSVSTQQNFPDPTDLAPEELRFRVQEFNSRTWFQMAFSIRWPNINEKLSLYKVVLWKDASDYFSQFKRFRQTLWLWLAVTIVLLMIVIWLVMRWSLKPLRVIGEEVSAIEEGRKHRFDSTYPAEIKPLTQNLNLLLQREEHQMQRYRHALDDLAHSLKTPLAVLRGLTEKRHLSQEDLNTLREQNDRMNQIVSYQLQKAATVGGELMSKPVDLTGLVGKTCHALTKVYRDKPINIECDLTNNILVRMDESDLMELFGNLIDNACKYGKSRVHVAGVLVDDVVRIVIEDDGKGLEQGQLDHILNRGIRLDQTHEGQGIGLAVVHEIIQAYEIGLVFGQSSSLGGLSVELTLAMSE
jgi:two-component system sensor histidine kinase PhoQ